MQNTQPVQLTESLAHTLSRFASIGNRENMRIALVGLINGQPLEEHFKQELLTILDDNNLHEQLHLDRTIIQGFRARMSGANRGQIVSDALPTPEQLSTHILWLHEQALTKQQHEQWGAEYTGGTANILHEDNADVIFVSGTTLVHGRKFAVKNAQHISILDSHKNFKPTSPVLQENASYFIFGENTLSHSQELVRLSLAKAHGGAGFRVIADNKSSNPSPDTFGEANGLLYCFNGNNFYFQTGNNSIKGIVITSMPKIMHDEEHGMYFTIQNDDIKGWRQSDGFMITHIHPEETETSPPSAPSIRWWRKWKKFFGS